MRLSQLFLDDDIRVTYGGQTGYRPFLRTLYLNGPENAGTILHELVHVYNNPSRLDNKLDDRVDEGMAYTFEAMYNIMAGVYDAQADVDSGAPCDQIRKDAGINWALAWSHGKIPIQGQLNDAKSTVFEVNGGDFGRVQSVFRARVKCSEIATELNKRQGADRCCLRFSCEASAKNYREIGIKYANGNYFGYMTNVLFTRGEIHEGRIQTVSEYL